MLDKHGYIVATTEIVAGNHNDAYKLKSNLRDAFNEIKQLGLRLRGAYFNTDNGFDTREARKLCFNHGLIPNIPENKRNRKRGKPGPKRLFNVPVYKERFCAERTFAWVDKFKRLIIRFERMAQYFLGLPYVAFAMINLRNTILKV